ncbi:hypothetical protein [Paraburkholderia caledonica]|uniref:hypothetical protein n=1 Tax=Paraburkholderia caledonica TaxID=134536 RepID=UPI0038BA53B6
MGYKTYTLMTLLAVSNAAQAWQPLVYPVQSQSAYQRSVDSALCYASANKETKVNTVREAQIPPPKPAATKTSSTGAPSRPPLPPSTFSAAPAGPALPDGTAPAAPNAASAPQPGVGTASNGASAPRATPASGVPAAPKTADAGHAASAALPPSAAIGDKPASEPATTASAAGASQPGTAALPPLPAPEPPMTRYWAAYGACMQARGYVVAQ